MKSPCLLLKVVIPTTIRCKIDNTKVEQWAIAVFATDRCRNDKALPRKFIFVFLYSGIIRCKELVQKRAEWFHFDLRQQHTDWKAQIFFQRLFNQIQKWQGCQKKWKTMRNVNLAVFCAKIPLQLKNLEKCWNWAKNGVFFCVLFKFTKI